MKSMTLTPQQMVIAHSRYRFGREIATSNDSVTKHLKESLNDNGQITPLLLMTETSGERHLVDGFKRAALLTSEALTSASLNGTLLPTTTTPLTLARLVFDESQKRMERSFVDRARFLSFALAIGVPRSDIITHLAPLAQLESSEALFRKVEKALTLPHDVLDYAALKNFSLKQLLSFRRAPEDVLTFVFGLRATLPLTASIISELCERINDHLRATGSTIDGFDKMGHLTALLDSDDDARTKLLKLRQILAELRMPTLDALNKEMDKILRDAALPQNVAVTWDRSLERCSLTIAIEAAKANQLAETLTTLAAKKKPLLTLFKNL